MAAEFAKVGPQRIELDAQDYPDGVLRIRRKGDTNDRLQILESGVIRVGTGATVPAVKGAFLRRTITSGSYVINGTAWANLDTTTDISLAAAVGDIVTISISGSWGTEAVFGFIDVVTVVANTPVRTFSTEIAENAAGFGISSAIGYSGFQSGAAGTLSLVLTAADIENGAVLLRLRRRTATAANKTFSAVATAPFVFQARIH